MKITAKRQIWIDHINAWNQTSLSMVDYANQHNLKIRHFYHIKSELAKVGLPDGKSTLRDEGPLGGFAKVQVSPKTPPAYSQQCEVKMPSGLALCFDADLPPSTLRSLVMALGEITS